MLVGADLGVVLADACRLRLDLRTGGAGVLLPGVTVPRFLLEFLDLFDVVGLVL